MGCFFFNDTATTEIYTLSLHDALPIFILAVANLGSSHRDEGGGFGRLTAKTLAYYGTTSDRKSTRLNSSHVRTPRMPSSA